MKKVLTIGEALIDFIPSQKGCKLKEVVSFEKIAGGAPANVSAVIAKLGGEVGFISQLGMDAFGDYIIDCLREVGVDTSYILRTTKANTGLAFVSLQNDGNRDFSFYRNPSADMLLKDSNLQEEWFRDCYALHFCSVDLVESPMKGAHRKAIDLAIANGGIVSFDPNVRLPLWPSEDDCKKATLEFLPYAHILKISDEELEFITGENTIENAKEMLFKGNVQLVLFTKGKDGAEIHTKDNSVKVEGNKLEVVDTTGAGDSFIGSFLYLLAKEGIGRDTLSELSKSQLKKYLSFANYYAGYSTLGKGAIGSYATLEQINAFIKAQQE